MQRLKTVILKFARIKRYLLYITLCFVITVGCSERKDEVSDVTISEDTMVKIIKDMTKANYMITVLHNDAEEQRNLKRDYKNDICKRYNTDTQTYDHDLKIYLNHTQTMQRILEKAKQ